MHVAVVSFRGESGPFAQAEQLDGARRLLGNAREISGHGVGHVAAPGVLERAAEHSPRCIEQQESFLRPFERSEEHTSELQSRLHLVCRLLLEKKKKKQKQCLGPLSEYSNRS